MPNKPKEDLEEELDVEQLDNIFATIISNEADMLTESQGSEARAQDGLTERLAGASDIFFSKQPDGGRISWIQCASSSNDHRISQHELLISNGGKKASSSHREPPIVQHGRSRRRVLFQECCKPYFDIDDLALSWKVVQEYIWALNLFRKAGYLHRDISGRNCQVLEVEDESGSTHYHPKLFDLEHCKKYLDYTSHDPITGTYEFIAVEVGQKKFKVWGEEDTFELSSAPPAKKPDIGFHNHYFHELESIVWLVTLKTASGIPCQALDGKDNLGSDLEVWDKKLRALFITEPCFLFRELLLKAKLREVYASMQAKEWWSDTLFRASRAVMGRFAIEIMKAYKNLHSRSQHFQFIRGEPGDFRVGRWTDEDDFPEALYNNLSTILQESIDQVVEEDIRIRNVGQRCQEVYIKSLNKD
ncbi:hypothetical protein DFP72DRAFT_1180626 [Ephemerocybe angulata]|uniref:Fungal-type protein kinase domain-containing protein n=1 Tax=Ephemerocybe angulata TaxID=980116 RepID=A0A8H6LRV4_9AGAR|nr:hypothetical protein DFP72DRAFT_1180626 [Tulosesus angulatus]